MDIEKKAKKTERVVTKCEKCNKPLSYDPNHTILLTFDPEHPVCKACTMKEQREELKEKKRSEEERENEVAFTRKCKEVDCGKEFSITTGEAEFYYSHNLALPERCGLCRAKRKAMRELNAANNHEKSNTP